MFALIIMTAVLAGCQHTPSSDSMMMEDDASMKMEEEKMMEDNSMMEDDASMEMEEEVATEADTEAATK